MDQSILMERLDATLQALGTAFDNTFEAQPGKKYIRIVSMKYGASAYAFIDLTGNIYKPAGWKAPAKHVRGNIFDENFSINKAFGPYGVAYLR